MVAFPKPTFHEERDLLARGFTIVAGVDEAGTGAWAGPVYAAAVILPMDSRIGLVRDSKTLSFDQRRRVAEALKREAAAWAIGTATLEEIAERNVRGAGTLAMLRAVQALSLSPQFVLVDAFRIPGLALPSKSIIRGDAKVKSIAAASVIAKTERDACMLDLDGRYPGYGFADHKGYGTGKHQEALRRLGPCPVHRMTFAPLRAFVAGGPSEECKTPAL